MDDKRAVSRRRTYYAAQVSCQNGIVWSDGLVRNLCDTGALVETQGSPVPDMLDIAIPMAGLRTRARVVWRAKGRAGLQFERTAARPAPSRSALKENDANY